jgi:hypothetical protein
VGRIIRVRLTVNNPNAIRTELEDPGLNKLFNEMDADEFFKMLRPEQIASEQNTIDRKNKKQTIKKGQRLKADDYPGEPPYAHAGIHLRFDDKDEIEWFSDEELNFIIDVGPDPELYLLQEDLDPGQRLSKVELHDHKTRDFHNPFERDDFPLVCVNGKPQRSGALKNQPRVREQRYYKFSVTLLGTEITLDPHIDGH